MASFCASFTAAWVWFENPTVSNAPRLNRRGKAIAARTALITITAISSVRLNPRDAEADDTIKKGRLRLCTERPFLFHRYADRVCASDLVIAVVSDDYREQVMVAVEDPNVSPTLQVTMSSVAQVPVPADVE